MPITICRKTGKVSCDEPTKEQRQAAWEVITRNFVKNNPELFKKEIPANGRG